MPLDPMAPDQVDALGRMNHKIYNEYKNLGYAGLAPDPVRFLAFRRQTNNDRFLELVVSDAGVFFFDPARKIKYKFNPGCFFLYHDGFSAPEREKCAELQGPLVVMDNLLEFWNRPGTGLCLVKDHLNQCDYLLDEEKKELEKIKRLYSQSGFTISPMLQKKTTGPGSPSPVGVLDLES